MNVGVPRIDHEHRVFLDLLSKLSEEQQHSDNREYVLDLLRELELYAQFHFCSEENIMKKAEYPDLEAHANEHTMLLGKLRTRIREYQTRTIALGDIVSFLFEWFSFHTSKMDQALASYLQSERAEIASQLSIAP